MLTYIFICVLGLCFGSLGSVLLTRLETINKKSLKSTIFGRSVCFRCKKKLNFVDLIPLIWFLINRKKCRFCKKEIPRIYPILELWTAIIFLITYIILSKSGLSDNRFLVGFWLLVNWLLFLSSVYDIQKYQLHIAVWLTTLTLSVLGGMMFGWIPILQIFLSAVIWWGFFYIIYFGAKRYAKNFKNMDEWLWEWDVWVAILIWTLNPFVFVYHNFGFEVFYILRFLIIFVILSSILWIIWFAILKLLKNNEAKIPFIPAMILAFWSILVFWKFFFDLLSTQI